MSEQDKIIFQDLYDKYYKSIFGLLMKFCKNPELAEDLTQETFINIFRSLDSFDPERGNFKAWSSSIARNIFLNYINKNSKVSWKDMPPEEISELPHEVQSLSEQVEEKFLQEDLLDAIESLPEPEKSIIRCRFLRKMTLRETSAELKISGSTVNRRLIKGMELLRQALIQRNISWQD